MSEPVEASRSKASLVIGPIVLLGAALLLYGLYLILASDMPLPLGIAVATLGAGELLCAHFARQRVRTAWAFLCSMNGTCVLVTLFGAPKIRDAADLAMGLALLPCVIFVVVTVLLIIHADDLT